MWLSRYFVWFVVYGCMGWVFETIYCTAITHKWANRGFLFGPICPIYGVGGLAISCILELFARFDGDLKWWHIYILSAVGSAIMEFITSWVLEKLFHAYWWDYSERRFNIQGRVCLGNTLLFGIAGLVVIYGIYPFMTSWSVPIPGIAMEAISLVLMALLSADMTLTVSELTDLDENIVEMSENIQQHMTQFVDELEEKRQDAKTKRIAEERLRIAKQHTTRLAGSMSRRKRSVVKRVAGFKRPGFGKKEPRLNLLREAMQNYQKSRKKDQKH